MKNSALHYSFAEARSYLTRADADLTIFDSNTVIGPSTYEDGTIPAGRAIRATSRR